MTLGLPWLSHASCWIQPQPSIVILVAVGEVVSGGSKSINLLLHNTQGGCAYSVFRTGTVGACPLVGNVSHYLLVLTCFRSIPFLAIGNKPFTVSRVHLLHHRVGWEALLPGDRGHSSM